MKKVLLIIAVVLCVGVAATALGFEFNGAKPKTGVLTADKAIMLTLDSSASSSVLLTPGVTNVYPLSCGFERSATATQSVSGELTITLSNSGNYKMDEVSVTVYSDEECLSPLTGKTRTGAGAITIQNITQNTTFYIGISVPNDIEDPSTTGGKINFAFTHIA